MEFDKTILDGENYRNVNEGFGYKEIVMRQLSKVVNNSSQEMRKGFWVYAHPGPNINPEKMRYIGDSRKELTQSIDVLHDLLLPKFDETIKTKSEELNKKIDEFRETSSKETSYWRKKLQVYRELFQAICLFLERLGWLEGSEVEE